MGQNKTMLPCNVALRNVETIRGILSRGSPDILFTGVYIYTVYTVERDDLPKLCLLPSTIKSPQCQELMV